MSEVGPLIVELDDEAALDPNVVGAKAAWLARGRRASLPVLPGFVITVAASGPLIRLGLELLRQRGSGAARMALSGAGLPEDVCAALNGAMKWTRMAVRSSSVLEGSGEWSGAFTSYLDVGTEDLAKTITGCWASTFSVATLERYSRIGQEPMPMGVMIQPFLAATGGGIAQVSDSTVVIDSVAGHPVSLLSGHQRGRRSVVDRSNGCIIGFEADLVEAVARLAVDAHEETGANSMEWAAVGNEVFVLQLARSTRPVVEEQAMVVPGHPDLLRLARITRRFPGHLGAAMVLPWALAMVDSAGLDHAAVVASKDLAAGLTEARRIASALTNHVWQSSNGEQLASAALAELAGDPARVLPVIGRLQTPSRADAARIIGLLRGVAVRLCELGNIGHPDEVWYLSNAYVQSPTGAPKVPLRLGMDRWEPLGAAVTEAHGLRSSGEAASAGIGLGRGHVVNEPTGGLIGGEIGPRRVIIAREPIPHLAPLLWSAAGLVTLSGSPGAHLFESARSLGVPAVAAVDLDLTVLASSGWAVSVDGTRGSVAVIDW